jgi:hypothetical protein
VRAGPGGEIEARYDEGLGMLLFESRRARSWPHGTTIDGILTLDLDADHVLANGEFMWLRERWPRGSVTLPTPQKGYFAARLSNLSTATLTTPTNVTALLVGADLVIEVGTTVPTERIRLGPNVDALASDGTFVGLVVTNP